MRKNTLSKFYNLVNYNKNNNEKILYEEFLSKNEMQRYNDLMIEMYNIYDSEYNLSELNENNNDVISLIKNNEFEIDNIENFIESINQSSRSEYLTQYSKSDFNDMTTYKLKDYNIGYAIKSDGDIVSVHNNSNIGGIGKELIKSAIKNGGKKLDHFDGFLIGFYEGLGFKVVGSDEWNDDYAPSNWNYEPIDIYNPLTSIYTHELRKYEPNKIPKELKRKIELYKEGKPDIVYREL